VSGKWERVRIRVRIRIRESIASEHFDFEGVVSRIQGFGYSGVQGAVSERLSLANSGWDDSLSSFSAAGGGFGRLKNFCKLNL